MGRFNRIFNMRASILEWKIFLGFFHTAISAYVPEYTDPLYSFYNVKSHEKDHVRVEDEIKVKIENQSDQFRWISSQSFYLLYLHL